MSTITSLSLCARVTLDMHSLNNEGTEGNQQMTRMVHILDQHRERQSVNAVSGDMLKHILVEHLTPLLAAAGQPLSPGARRLDPDRITTDAEFVSFCEQRVPESQIMTQMLTQCAATDLAGALVTRGRSVGRKSVAEFAWAVGLPDVTRTEQYFHVKYAPEGRGDATGGDTVAGRQAIFHRPASSGEYALVCNLDLYRIGLNDITRQYVIPPADRLARARALLQALAATLLKPTGAQRNTQSPHLLDAAGIISWSVNSLPAPALSPLKDSYQDQVRQCVASLNRIQPHALDCRPFDSLSAGLEVLVDLAERLKSVGGA
jgi:CRISPR-associated protein Cst2